MERPPSCDSLEINNRERTYQFWQPRIQHLPPTTLLSEEHADHTTLQVLVSTHEFYLRRYRIHRRELFRRETSLPVSLSSHPCPSPLLDTYEHPGVYTQRSVTSMITTPM